METATSFSTFYGVRMTFIKYHLAPYYVLTLLLSWTPLKTNQIIYSKYAAKQKKKK